MSLEPRSVSSRGPGFLQGCLVEGDPEQRTRERRIRRRALVISVLLQSAVLIALVLIPLFGKPAHIFAHIVLPPGAVLLTSRTKTREHRAPPAGAGVA